MRGFLTHFLARLRLTVTTPGALFLVLLAGVSSLLLWPWFLGDLISLEPILDLTVQPWFLFLWPMMLAMAAAAPLPMGGSSKGFVLRALPALPIDPAARVLGELLPPLLLALLARWAGGEAIRWWLGAWDLFFVGPHTRGEFAWQTLVGASVLLPVLAAWSPRARVDWTYLLRPAAAALVMFALLKLGSASSPLLAPCLGVLLAIAFYAAPDFEGRLRARPKPRPASPHERMSHSRPGLDPASRLRRDLWTGSLRTVGPWGAPFVILAPAVPLAARLDFFSLDQGDFWFGLVLGGSMSLFGITTLFPLGVHILKTDRLSGSGTLMSGAFCDAWAALPVRRDAVSRAVYAHTWIAGAAWCLFVTGFSLLSQQLLSTGLSWLRFTLPLALALPALAAFLTCMAIGDRIRGTIALAALLCVLPAHIGSQLACAAAGLSARSPAVLAVDVAAVFVLGAVGGLPGLVHLRRRPDAVRSPAGEIP